MSETTFSSNRRRTGGKRSDTLRILLIGGTGFLSSKILSDAVALGHHVTYMTRGQRPRNTDISARHITADRDSTALREVFGAERFDAVIDSVCRTAEHARQAVGLAQGGRLLMVSTEYVYHPSHRRLRQSEDDAVYSEFDDYGGNKRRAELEVLSAHRAGAVSAIIVRPPHIYGPGSNPGTIPMHGRKRHLLDDIASGKTLRLLQGGLCLIHPIYRDDFAGIILKLIDRPEAYGEAINCSGPQLMTHRSYYETLARLIGHPLSIEPFFADDDAERERLGINRYVAGHRYYDLAKLNRILPDLDYTPFETGMERWVRWLQQAS